MCRGVCIQYFKINPPIFCGPLFSESYLNPQVKTNQMVNKHNVDYHPSPLQLISRIHPLRFLWTPQGFISPEFFLIFFTNLYIPPWLRKSFKFIVLRLLQIHLLVKKLNLFIFNYAPKQNPSLFPRQKELSIILEQCFLKIFFQSRKGEEDYGVKKLTKLTSVLVTSLDKLHHLCNLYIFGLCFAVQ